MQKTSQKNYNFLSSTNLIYRNQLPPEYSLPTLVGGHPQDLRGLNTIDNEEQIPEIDFRDALAKFEIDTNDDGIDDGNTNLMHNSLRKAYSENELSKYDDQSGRRKSQCEPKNDILNWEPQYNHNHKKIILPNKEKFFDGIFDEYIPNFNTFNLSKFGIDENVLADSDSDDDVIVQEKKRHHSEEVGKYTELLTPLTETKPIEIKQNQYIKRNNDSFEVSDESFRIAASPERSGDREVLSSIPKNFSSLSFSYRRKMLTDLLPDSLKKDTDYKNHIAKIIRKNSASASSLSSPVSNIFALKRKPKQIDPDTNEMGSILLNKWRLGRIFNNGGFGIIRECFNVDDVDDIKAVKVIPIKHSLTCLQNFQSEIIMWSKLKNQYVVPLYDVKITCDYIFLFMPLYDEGSLFDRVKFWESNKIELVERYDTIISYLKCITKALTFLHENSIHHGDIKLENFVLENNIPLLCDFGMTDNDKDCESNTSSNCDIKIMEEIQSVCSLLANDIPVDKMLNTSPSDENGRPGSSKDESTPMDKLSSNIPNSDDIEKEHHINIGSLPYAAPELLQPCPTPVDRRADIWALGIMAYTLVILKLPFWHIYEPRLKLSILDGNWQNTEWVSALQGHPELSILDKLLKGCLVVKDSRFTISDVSNLLNVK